MADVTPEGILAARTARSDEVLRHASSHLYHEVAMLKFCGNKLVRDEPRHGWLYPAVMESFLIHARNLNEFFFAVEMAVASRGAKRIYPDDMIVEDFVGSIWHQKPTSNRLTKQQLEWINKQLAHLSYVRHEGGRYSTDFYRGVMDRLLAVVDAFLDVVTPARLDQRLLRGRPWRG